jgi:hypothetical protein
MAASLSHDAAEIDAAAEALEAALDVIHEDGSPVQAPEAGLDIDAPAELEGTLVASLEEPSPSLAFERALQSHDIAELGFDDAIRAALQEVGGASLFQLPASFGDRIERVAAVCLGAEDDRRIYLVRLAEDGGVAQVEEASDEASPLAGLAASYVDVMQRLAA